MQSVPSDTGQNLQPHRAALADLFHQQKDRVFRSAYRITGNSSDAEDVLQTVFLRLAGQESVGEIRNLPAYLHRSAVNAALDVLRRRTETASLETEPCQADLKLVQRTDRDLELRDWLRRALSRLNPRWAEMFVLRFVEDYSNHEIARMMGTSSAVVAVLLHRTRARLKEDYVQMTRSTP
ncbi:MAG TPA: sigma-70 family RNA polymerase sigma factor [Terriglobales bacterium]|nr:sigma-70 family RNA polymerase sigma factor [Terriglobales bacterium]